MTEFQAIQETYTSDGRFSTSPRLQTLDSGHLNFLLNALAEEGIDIDRDQIRGTLQSGMVSLTSLTYMPIALKYSTRAWQTGLMLTEGTATEILLFLRCGKIKRVDLKCDPRVRGVFGSRQDNASNHVAIRLFDNDERTIRSMDGKPIAGSCCAYVKGTALFLTSPIEIRNHKGAKSGEGELFIYSNPASVSVCELQHYDIVAVSIPENPFDPIRWTKANASGGTRTYETEIPLYAITKVDPDLLHSRAKELGMQPDSSLEEIKFEIASRLLAKQRGEEPMMKAMWRAIRQMFGSKAPRRQKHRQVALANTHIR